MKTPNLKHTLLAAVAFCLLAAASSCSPSNDDDDKNSSADQAYIDANEAYFNQCATLTGSDGKPYYTRVIPAWNSGTSVLMHWFNDRGLTGGNLTPMFTSTVAVKYEGRLYDGSLFDSSYSNTDSLFTTSLTGVIEGWVIALTQMHVGDSVKVVIPPNAGYGATATGNIPAYSTLVFNIKLEDIPEYEIK